MKLPHLIAKKPRFPGHCSAVIEVLGTQFNIMAYQDEDAIQTTLLEGSVKVTHNNKSDFLVPGRQASLVRASNELTVGEANVQQAVAWKNGFFILTSRM